MMTSLSFLTCIVYAALAITMLAPILLMGLFVRDLNKGELW